ncbi:MAG: Bug family tripartite tricarboxylate transporter substrate binding protein [Nitrospira sp.]
MLIDQDRAARPTYSGWPASHTRRIVPAALLLAIAASGIPLMEQAAAADALKSYPNRPIRLIVPQTPGSSLDTLARIFAIKMSEALGQQMVVDNRGGAGGLLGMEMGKDAPPDGYTLVAAGTSGMAIVPLIHKKARYDTLKDFEFISTYSSQPNVLVVNQTQPPKTVTEFIDWARARGSQLNMASAGLGSSSHLVGSHFMMAANLHSTHVPYKGGGPSVTAVVAGEAHWTLTPAAAVMSLVKSGRLRALGHTMPQRARLFGDLPAISETLTGFENVAQSGLIAPKGTAKPILDKLHNTAVKVVNSPEVEALFADQGAVGITKTPEEFRKDTAQYIARYGEIVRVVGLKAE